MVELVYCNRDNVNGLAFDYEPEYLRFFQSRFKRVQSSLYCANYNMVQARH